MLVDLSRLRQAPRGAILSLIMLVGVLTTQYASAAVPIDYGTCIQASIADTGEVDEYRFEAMSGDVVVVRMSCNQEENNLWPEIRVYGPSDSLLAQADHGFDARIDTLFLEETGTHTIQAADRWDTAMGDYGLHLQCVSSPGQAVYLTYDDCVQDSIGGSACHSTYTFEALSGDIVLIRMSGHHDIPLWPEIRVYGPSGSLLAQADHASDARIDTLLLGETGAHTILAGDSWGWHTGDYGLHLQCASSPGQATSLAYGDCVQDSIGGYACQATYAFQASAGDVVRVRMSDHYSTYLWPEIRVYGPGGSLLAAAHHATDTRIDTLQLEESGPHTILAGDRLGWYTGDYGLHLQCTSSPGQAAALAYGDCVGGSIQGLACVSTYTFEGQVGDDLTIWMYDAGPLWTELRLYDIHGFLLAEAAYHDDDVRISIPALAQAGRYTILAGDRQGYHSGEYTLCLTPTTGLPEEPPRIPDRVTISGFSPNPCTRKAACHVSLVQSADVVLRIHTVDGRLVLTRHCYLGAGEHTLDFDATDLASGTYFYLLKAGGVSRQGALVVIH